MGILEIQSSVLCNDYSPLPVAPAHIVQMSLSHIADVDTDTLFLRFKFLCSHVSGSHRGELGRKLSPMGLGEIRRAWGYVRRGC